MLAVSTMTPLPHSAMGASLIFSAYLRTRGSPWSMRHAAKPVFTLFRGVGRPREARFEAVGET
jgi:hypothetical protein